MSWLDDLPAIPSWNDTVTYDNPTVTGVTPDPAATYTSSDPAQSITRLAGSLGDSISSLIGWGNNAAQEALTLKNTIFQLEGKKVPSTTQVATAQNNLLNGTLSPQAQNILIIAGIIAAGVGVIYFLKK